MTQQKAVNGDVQEAVDTLDYVLQSGLALWESFPDELKALVLLVFLVSVLLQWVKKALLVGKPKRVRVQLLGITSMPLGIALAFSGALLAPGAIAPVYWFLIGLTAGPISMGVHFVTMKAIVPLIRAIWGRVMLAARGVPRD